MTNKTSWSKGQWQAYVTQGESKEERGSRLEEVPISMRLQVKRHVETVFAVKKYYKQVRSGR